MIVPVVTLWLNKGKRQRKRGQERSLSMIDPPHRGRDISIRVTRCAPYESTVSVSFFEYPCLALFQCHTIDVGWCHLTHSSQHPGIDGNANYDVPRWPCIMNTS